MFPILKHIPVWMLGLAAAVATAAPPVVKFDLAAQPMEQALTSFAAQASVRIIFFPEAVKGLKGPKVSGSYTSREALERLLINSGLKYEFVNEKTVSIRPLKDTSSSGLDPGDQMRVATAREDGGQSDAEEPWDRNVSQVVVEGEREKRPPLSSANVDLPRSANDVQPYYIMDAETIRRSGAPNVEEFLKIHLPMNTMPGSSAQNPGSNQGNTSTLNLRGLGQNNTLVLINGRRVSGVTLMGIDYQTDLNGLPMDAIERIEVLPSSASGIHGGGAIGGVVNVILRSNYSGGEVRLMYDDIWDGDAPNRRVSGMYGTSFEDGKTRVVVSGQWSESRPMIFGDRRALIERGLRRVERNAPSLIYSGAAPFLGATPNISRGRTDNTPLILFDGRSLLFPNTFVPAGTGPGLTRTALGNLLLPNAGRWNLELPPVAQSPTGLLQPMGASPTIESFTANLSRALGGAVEAFIDASYQSNHSEALRNPFTSLSVARLAPSNPFSTAVRVQLPSTLAVQQTSDSVTRTLAAGLNVKLPHAWMGKVDYSWSENRFDNFMYNADTTAAENAILGGTLNPFVDTLLYPLNLEPFLAPAYYSGVTGLSELALRATGPLMQLPWGVPTLAVALSHRKGGVRSDPASRYVVDFPASPARTYRTTYFDRMQTADSVYAELHMPLLPADRFRLARELILQVSGRGERFTVDTGTAGYTEYPFNPALNAYIGPTLPGLQPFKDEADYLSRNITLGFKYRPVDSVTVRASMASAFLPPTPAELTENPITRTSQVIDPLTGLPSPEIEVRTGGNANLKPQHSRGFNAGLIWEPAFEQAKGLRFNAEFYRIKQFDQISSLEEQFIVDAGDTYADRVTRDENGEIAAVDASALNLYKSDTSGWDFGVNYSFATSAGTFDLHAAATRILYERRQLYVTLPEYDYAGYVAEGGPGKARGNLTLTWRKNGWTAGWTSYYFSAYRQYGAAGGPLSLRLANGQVFSNVVQAQGSQSIPSQLYHDLVAEYSFDGPRHAFLEGLRLQGGIRNLFDTAPPFDANYGYAYYISPYGDRRLRNYWITASKRF